MSSGQTQESPTTFSATSASDTITTKTTETTETSAVPTTTQTTDINTTESGKSSESSGTTTTEPLTTLSTSFITTTSDATTTTTESSETFTGPYPCFNYGGPKIATPYCACKTTTAGQTFMTNAPPISGQCHYYHTYPASVTLVRKESLPLPEPTPITFTRSNGVILSYPDRTTKIDVYPGGKYTHTDGKGTPSMIRPATPRVTATDDFDKESCYDFKDSCDRAASRYKDDFRYTEVAIYGAVERSPLRFWVRVMAVESF